MPELIIELNEAEYFALDLIARDKQEWAHNFLINRARVAKEELKAKPAWVAAAVALAKDGGDATDEWAILLKGKQLGLFPTALQISEKAEAEAQEKVDEILPDQDVDAVGSSVIDPA